MKILIDTNYNTDLMAEIGCEIQEVKRFIENKTFEECYDNFPWEITCVVEDDSLFDFYTDSLSGTIEKGVDGKAQTSGVWSYYRNGECIFDFEEVHND
jgi:hypothetical protein